MTREEAIDELSVLYERCIKARQFPNKFYCSLTDGQYIGALDMAIETLEQTKWIPVSERLPEVGSEVLVCYEFKKKRYVYIANFYGDGEFHGYDDEYLTTEGRKYRKAVAWMPLPQPYKAESEDKE